MVQRQIVEDGVVEVMGDLEDVDLDNEEEEKDLYSVHVISHDPSLTAPCAEDTTFSNAFLRFPADGKWKTIVDIEWKIGISADLTLQKLNFLYILIWTQSLTKVIPT